MAKRKVLMTGASGYIASLMLPTLRDRFDMVLADVSDTDRDGNKIEGIHIANFIDTDRSKYAHLFEGVDAVIHLAFKPHVTRGEVSEKAPIDRFDNEHENVQMANNIYRSAYDAGVRRLAIASSNHAAAGNSFPTRLRMRARREASVTIMAGANRTRASTAEL